MSFTRYQKNFANCFPFSNTNLVAQLATSTALGWTVPGVATQKFRIKFRSSSTAEIFVAYNATAVVPTAATATSSSNQEMIPLDECRYVKGGDTLSFISTTGTPQVSASLLMIEDTTNFS
jgi:hypothetical protein